MIEVETKILNVNLQEGLLLNDNNSIIGGFSRHLNRVFIKVPFVSGEVLIPKELEGFEVVYRRIDSIGLTAWTIDGRKDLNDIY